MSNPLADIEVIKRVVVEAGRRAAARCGTVSCEHKADLSLVTDADRENEEFIYQELRTAYPDYAFIGEEFGWRGPEGVPLWACDPIDGTTNYVNGLPEWCVSVGLLYEGAAVMGAVYVPRTDELFWGSCGEGSFVNGIRLHAPDSESLHVEDPICLTSNTVKTLQPGAVAGRVRCLGTIAAELCYTAAGRMRATVGLHEGIVDMAGAFCICAEAGCAIHHLDGPPLDVNELIRIRRTDRHFVVAPLKLLQHIQQALRPNS